MDEKKFIVSVLLQVEIEAFTYEDAAEAIEDVFGEGETCGLDVIDLEILDHDELN